MSGGMPSTETQNVRCVKDVGLSVSCCNLPGSSLVSNKSNSGKVAVCRGVKVLYRNIFGVTGTDAWIIISRVGSIDQQRNGPESLPPPLPPPPQPPPPRPLVKQRNHNDQNSHQLAPQHTTVTVLGARVGRIRRRPCSGSTSRSLGGRSRRNTSVWGRFCSRNQQCGNFFTYNRADRVGGRKKYIFTVPFFRGKIFTAPPR